jgi:hypothetical protein
MPRHNVNYAGARAGTRQRQALADRRYRSRDRVETANRQMAQVAGSLASAGPAAWSVARLDSRNHLAVGGRTHALAGAL